MNMPTDQIVRAASPDEIAKAERKAAERNDALTAAAQTAAAPPPAFVNPGARQRVVPLEYPVISDGEVVSEIIITRPTMRQWREYMRQIAVVVEAGGDEDTVDAPYLSQPAAVIDQIDFKDYARLEAEMESFFGWSPSATGTTEEGSQSTTG